MDIVIALAALGLMVGVLLYLVQFLRQSRHASLFHPAESANIRRARRITGMYARGDEQQLFDRGADNPPGTAPQARTTGDDQTPDDQTPDDQAPGR